MIPGRRYWQTGPEPETNAPAPRRRRPKATAIALAVSVLALAAVMVLMLCLIMARTHYRDEQQQQINATFCDVLDQLPAGSVELDRIRQRLGCTNPGLSPDQLKQLTDPAGAP